eukprot:6226968-Prymnesium_polylepis.1
MVSVGTLRSHLRAVEHESSLVGGGVWGYHNCVPVTNYTGEMPDHLDGVSCDDLQGLLRKFGIDAMMRTAMKGGFEIAQPYHLIGQLFTYDVMSQGLDVGKDIREKLLPIAFTAQMQDITGLGALHGT